jgi:hypothetical protein
LTNNDVCVKIILLLRKKEMAKFKVGQVVYVTNADLGYKDEVGRISTIKPYLDGKILYGVILGEGSSLPKYFYEDEIISLSFD